MRRRSLVTRIQYHFQKCAARVLIKHFEAGVARLKFTYGQRLYIVATPNTYVRTSTLSSGARKKIPAKLPNFTNTHLPRSSNDRQSF